MTSSRLFHLVPFAIASTEIESLTSYIRRLAFAHVVSPSTLVRELVLKPRQQVMARANLMFEPTRIGESLNGASGATEVTVSALEALTGRRDLRAMTFSALADGIELRSAFRAFRAWCRSAYLQKGRTTGWRGRFQTGRPARSTTSRCATSASGVDRGIGRWPRAQQRPRARSAAPLLRVLYAQYA